MSQAAARMLNTDLQGSVTSVTDFGGNPIAINRYDEYGRPQSGNAGRFQYTGQAWLPEIGLYYYKARMYSPTLGRFMQTDPIGYADGVNWYNYVGGDPVNGVDPTGEKKVCLPQPGSRIPKCIEVEDEDGDGDIDSNDQRAAEYYLNVEFAGGMSAENQQALQHRISAILNDPNIAPSVKEAQLLTLKTNLEHGFMIYYSGYSHRYWAGEMRTGTSSTVTFPGPCGLMCPMSILLGYYHTHPNGGFGISGRDDDMGLANRHNAWIVADHFSGIHPRLSTGYFIGRASYKRRN